MKLLLILVTWLIVSIPTGILFGRFFAAGNGFLADSAPSSEKRPDNSADFQTLEEQPAKRAA